MLHEHLGARARNECGRTNFEIASEEGPAPDEILDWFVTPRTRDPGAQLGQFIWGEFTLRLHVQLEPLTSEHTPEQDLRDSPWTVHLTF
jgi:hypothetical protein